jgi:phage terminase Nu1 subunit (DNA packaging protein)
MKQLSYPANVLARLFNLTERRIQQLAKDGVIVRGERGKYDFIASVRGYIGYLQERSIGRGDGEYDESGDIKEERKRLIHAQAEKTESENYKLRGELIPIQLVEECLNEVAVLYGSGVDALPGRLANELAGVNDPAEIKSILFAECRRIRQATAASLAGLAENYKRDNAVGDYS